MELLLDIVADGILDLLGKISRRCKSARTQIIVDILIAFVALLVVGGYVICYRRGNALAAVGVALGLFIFLMVGFVLFRRIIQKRKKDE